MYTSGIIEMLSVAMYIRVCIYCQDITPFLATAHIGPGKHIIHS